MPITDNEIIYPLSDEAWTDDWALFMEILFHLDRWLTRKRTEWVVAEHSRMRPEIIGAYGISMYGSEIALFRLMDSPDCGARAPVLELYVRHDPGPELGQEPAAVSTVTPAGLSVEAFVPALTRLLSRTQPVVDAVRTHVGDPGTGDMACTYRGDISPPRGVLTEITVYSKFPVVHAALHLDLDRIGTYVTPEEILVGSTLGFPQPSE